jgi:hypothetical protein
MNPDNATRRCQSLPLSGFVGPDLRPPTKRIFLAAAVLALGLASAARHAPAAEPNEHPHSHRPPVISPGEKAKVSLFGIEGEGYKFVYVFDRSGSMGAPGHEALPRVKAELIKSLQTIDEVHQFQIIYYNEQPKIFNPTGQPGRLVFGTDQNKATAAKFINSVVADGGTSHLDALRLAIRLRPDVIYLLTDGDDPKLTPKELERIDRLGAGIIINTIQFGAGPRPAAESFLAKLARQSGGQYAYVDISKKE